MSERKSWQEEEREENARREAEEAKRLQIEAEWVMGGKAPPLAMCYRIEELLEFAAIGVHRCRFCGALLYDLKRPDDGQVRAFGRDGSMHFCVCEPYCESLRE